jgi:hypothetical protein
LLKPAGEEKVFVKPRAGDSGSVTNSGAIRAVAAELKVSGNAYALAINNAGTIDATGVQQRGGRVYLTADGGNVTAGGAIRARNADGSGGRIKVASRKQAPADPPSTTSVTGVLDASGVSDDGGNIEVTGDHVGAMAGSRIDASGANNGGTILFGGGEHGSDPLVANAQATYVDKTATLAANGGVNGGKVVVWSDASTRFDGSISAASTLTAPASQPAGNGGFVEVSGKNFLDFNGTIDTRAAGGHAGMLVLDPLDLLITGTALLNNNVTPATPFSPTGASSKLTYATLLTALQLSDVTIQTGAAPGAAQGNITFGANAADIFTYPALAFSRTLTIRAYRDVNINAPINSLAVLGALNLNLQANNGGIGGAVNINQPITLLNGNLTANGQGINVATALTIPGATNLQSTGDLSVLSPISLNTASSFALNAAQNLNIGAAISNSGAGASTLNGGAIVLSAPVSTTSGALTVQATGNVTAAAGGNLQTSGGAIRVVSSAGDVTLNPAVTLASNGGDITVSANGSASIAAINAGIGNIAVSAANGAVTQAAGLLTGNQLTLTAGGGIGAALTPISTNVNALNFAAGGDVHLLESDGVTATGATNANNGLIDLRTMNPDTLTIGAAGISANGGGTVLISAENGNANGTSSIVLAGAVRSVTGDVTINAGALANGGGNIVDGIAGEVATGANSASPLLNVATGGNITLSAGGSVGSLANRLDVSAGSSLNVTALGSNATALATPYGFSASGNQGVFVTALGNTTLGGINSAQNVDVKAVASSVGGNGSLALTAPLATANNGYIALSADKNVTLNAPITAAGSGGVAISAGLDPIQLGTLTISAPISSTTGPLVVQGAGNVTLSPAATLQTNGGTIQIASTSGDMMMNAGSSLASSGGDITISANGNAALADINSGIGRITVNAGTGAITSTGGTLIGNQATLTAAAGIGTSSASINTSLATLNAIADTGNIFVNNAGAIDLQHVTTANGSINITAAGSITATDVRSATDASANGITLTSTGGGVTIGSVQVGVSTTATAGDVTIQAQGGAIDGASNPIVGNAINLQAATTIGSTANPVNSSANALSFNAGGDVHVLERDAITVTGETTANNGAIDLRTAIPGTITIGTTGISANGSGNVLISAQDGNANGASSIVLAGAVRSATGDITINAGALANGGGNIVDGIAGEMATGASSASPLLNVATGGNITLNAGGSVGSLANRLDVSAGGSLNVTAPGNNTTPLATPYGFSASGNQGVFVTALGNATLGTINSAQNVDIKTVASNLGGDGSLALATPLATANNGYVTLSADKDITLNVPVTASGSGGVAISAGLDSAQFGTLTINAPISSTTGPLVVQSAGSVTLSPAATLQTNGGTIQVASINSDVTMNAGSTLTSGGGDITISANGNAGLADIDSGSASITVNAGSGAITNAGGTLAGSQLTLQAPNGGIGTALAPVSTSVGELVFSSGGDVSINNSSALTVAGQTANNGAIKITSSSGDITIGSVATPALSLTGLSANGSGSVIVNANAGALNVMQAVHSATGSIDLQGSGNVTVSSDVASQGGVIQIASTGGDVTINGAASIASNGGTITVSANGNVQLAGLDAGAGAVTIAAANGSITQIGGAVTGSQLSLQALVGIGTALAPISTNTGELVFSSGGDVSISNNGALTVAGQTANSGSIRITSISGDLTIGSVATPALSVTGLSANGSGTVTVNVNTGALDLNQLVQSSGGDLDLVASGNVALTGAGTVSTGGAGTVHIASQTGDVTMTAGTSLASGGGEINVYASGNASLSDVNANTGGMFVQAVNGAITNMGGTLSGDQITLTAGGSIGANGNPIATGANQIVFVSGGDVHLSNSGSVSVAGQTTNNGSIDVATLGGGNLTVGTVTTVSGITAPFAATGQTVTGLNANGTGTIALSADGNLTVNATAQSGAGSITTTAGGDAILNAGVTTSAGNVSVVTGNNLTIASGGSITTGSGDVTIVVDNQSGTSAGGGSLVLDAGSTIAAGGSVTITSVSPAQNSIDAGAIIMAGSVTDIYKNPPVTPGDGGNGGSGGNSGGGESGGENSGGGNSGGGGIGGTGGSGSGGGTNDGGGTSGGGGNNDGGSSDGGTGAGGSGGSGTTGGGTTDGSGNEGASGGNSGGVLAGRSGVDPIAIAGTLDNGIADTLDESGFTDSALTEFFGAHKAHHHHLGFEETLPNWDRPFEVNYRDRRSAQRVTRLRVGGSSVAVPLSLSSYDVIADKQYHVRLRDSRDPAWQPTRDGLHAHGLNAAQNNDRRSTGNP